PVAGVEWRLAHQAMYAGLGAQPAIGRVALEFDRGTLHARHRTGIGIDHFARIPVRGAPPQIHAQEPLRPVLCLGSTGTRLDVQEGAVRIHLAAKHALELEAANLALEPLGVALDIAGGGLIALPLGELEELGRIADSLGGALDLRHVRGEPCTLLPELLRPLRLRPDRRVLELPAYFLEPLFLAVVFKETPVARRCARRGL